MADSDCFDLSLSIGEMGTASCPADRNTCHGQPPDFRQSITLGSVGDKINL